MKRRTLRGGALTVAGMLTLLCLATPATAAPRVGGADFSCRASAIRVVTKIPAALTVEPFVANAPDAPCVAEEAGLIDPTTVGPVTADVVSATTSLTPANLASAPPANGDNATARASVTNPAIALPGLAISAAVLTATASYTCQNGVPVPGGAPVVTNLVINGTTVAVPPGPLTIPLGPLGSLELNQTVQEPNRITTRAFNLTTPAVDIVIAEATADLSGNPCAAPPQCSDTIDNDGDGKADANDPGCLSGPGGTYDPLDNDERDTECSDVGDNDGDGKIDAKDPGCLSGPGGTYNPLDDDERDTECSDGADNDKDGKIDFPEDKGCTSATDDSERTPPGTSKLGSDPAAIARLGVRGPCVSRSFAAVVTGKSISRVAFSLDGRRVGTVSRAPFRTRLAPSAAGRHTVTARVTFLGDSGTRARTLSFQFVRCPPRVRLTG
jgi:hypothetical protein